MSTITFHSIWKGNVIHFTDFVTCNLKSLVFRIEFDSGVLMLKKCLGIHNSTKKISIICECYAHQVLYTLCIVYKLNALYTHYALNLFVVAITLLARKTVFRLGSSYRYVPSCTNAFSFLLLQQWSGVPLVPFGIIGPHLCAPLKPSRMLSKIMYHPWGV